MENRYIKLAQTAILDAEDLIRQAESALKDSKRDASEELYRRSLTKIREAFLLDRKRETSVYLHNIGRRVHDTFGCVLAFKEGNYWVTCPVVLSHGGLGFSIGGSCKSICSICGQDTFACSHVSGRLYDGVVAKRYHNVCNICREGKGCQHSEGQTYDGVQAFSIVEKLDLDHIAFVQNPADPLCVVNAHTLTESDVLGMLPQREKERFVFGKTTIYCHHCSACGGIP